MQRDGRCGQGDIQGGVERERAGVERVRGGVERVRGGVEEEEGAGRRGKGVAGIRWTVDARKLGAAVGARRFVAVMLCWCKCVCVCAYVRACVRACVRVEECGCAWGREAYGAC